MARAVTVKKTLYVVGVTLACVYVLLFIDAIGGYKGTQWMRGSDNVMFSGR